MERRGSLATRFVVAIAILSSGAGAEIRGEHSRRTPIVEAVAKTRAGIVRIKVEKKNNWGRTEKSVGTSIIVDAHGYVVSNRHVILGASCLSVCCEDGTELPAHVAAEEPESDLAILRVQGGKGLHALTLGPGSDLMVGETVIAVGHPFGYNHTVSTGIISAVGRKIVLPTGEELSNLIQTDASINPGNSGGPLLNINGELIGINVALREGAQNIAFALNADTVQRVLSKHLSARKVSQLGHGLSVKEVVKGVEGRRQQVVVEDVRPKSPAAAAGVKPGDVVVKVGKRPVTNRFDLERALWGVKPGDCVEAAIVREGKDTRVEIRFAGPVETERVASATD